ncbi:MAG: tetratricopeptide repeat protein [Flavipsychrobacter sp.]
MLFKKYSSFLLIVISISFLFGLESYAQDEYRYLLHKTYAERVPLFDTTVFQKLKHADSADWAKAYTTIKRLAEKEGDEGLLMEAKLGNWYYLKHNNYYGNEEAVDELKLLLDEANQKSLDKYVVLIRFELAGQYFYHLHNYQKAFTQYIENYSAVTQISSADLPNKKSIIVHTGNAYYNFRDYVNAKKYLLIADTVNNSWRTKVGIQCKNTLGLIHRNNKQYDSAIYYFEQCIAIAKQTQDSIWEAIVLGNIGISYYQQGFYEKAIPLLKRDVEGSFSFGAFDNGVNSIVKLVDAFVEVGDLEQAKLYLDRGWRFADSMRDKTKHLPALYNVSAKLMIMSGDYKQAHHLRDSADLYAKVLVERDDIMQLARVETRIRQEVHDKEIEKLNVEKELVTTVRNGLLIGLVLLTIITYLIINRQRIKHKTNRKILLFEKELTETKLQNASAQLESYTKSLQEKNLLIEKSTDEINRLQENLDQLDSEKNDNVILQQLYDSTILTDGEWEEFRRLFEQVHTGYINRLKEKLPGLSPADIRFIVLSKLKLSNKEMAGILGVQPDSMRTYKYRLRKKFNITDDETLSYIIDTI